MTSPRLVITAGEPAGIGPDVLLTALQRAFDARITVVGYRRAQRACPIVGNTVPHSFISEG